MWRKSWMVMVCLLLALQVGTAQKRPSVGSPEDTRRILIEKAHALEARGRPDMAIQSWQQILLSDPNNADALAGLARDYKLIGSADQSNAALERLRRVNPNDPNIGKIGSLNSNRTQSDRLRQAGELARQGKPEEAMRIYRELYGDRPPDGDIALAYYQTLYSTATGKEAAIAAMRALAQRNPGDTRFTVELGTMLTYAAKTRAEGIHILEAHPKDPNAQSALRQALIWDAANPASAAELRGYLKDHPQDTELAGHLKENESKLAQMNSGIARTPAERAAFAALNAHKLEEAQTRFSAILEQEPNNGRAAAGMGFLRMQQSNFGGAISFLSQALQNGYKDRAVEDALATSRFWYTMGEASQAFDENQFDVATQKYKAALAMRPRSPEALNGLAGLYVKQAQYTAAAGIYDELIKVQPGSQTAWRGLFLSYARDGQNRKALDLTGRFPAPVRASLAKDPEYLRTLATLYHAANRPAEAQRALSQALSLPYPDNGTNLKADTRLQYAGVLMEAKRFAQAAEMYTQILDEDAGSLSAWMGLVSAHHELLQDNQAIADVEKMPPATYEAALADPGFLSMLGAIYQQANQFDIAQGLLERSAKLQIAAGGQPAIPLQLQLAAIYLQRNNTAQAYAIYHQILLAHPDRVDAWKGLIASLQATNRNTEAIDEIALIPPAVRKELESDIEFVQGEASLYAASGDIAHATEYMNRVLVHYRDLKSQPPPAIDVQNAWLLFNTGNDRSLYPALMRLGGRQDLTATQREAVQSIWANWSVRRAGTAMDNGNVARAVDILDAAAQAFPDNVTVRKAVAGGYVKVGRAKDSLALFKTIPMQDATAGDFQGAIGAALSANDKVQAEVWLRQALDRYPRNPAILSLAARFEQARGDNQRAVDYWKASIAAMPQATPADRLAHTLVYPDQDSKARRAVTAADLQHLLDPNYEPFQRTTKLPPLPAYGADPYSGRAPVDLSQPQPVQPQNPWANPSTTDNSPSNPPDVNAAGTNPPMAQAPGMQFDDRADVAQAELAAVPARKAARSSSKSGKSANKTNYEGTMHVPAADRNIHAPRPAQPVVGSSNLLEPSASISQGKLTLASYARPVDDATLLSPRTVGNSLAADAWKGLVFSLLAANRIDEALQQIAQIPPDLRRELDADVDFVQGQASLYAATGDVQHATECMTRVENYYLLQRTSAPAGIEVQHAWLLYNTGNEHALYALLKNLDARRDLSGAESQQVQTIWANWSLRRAVAAMDAGNSRLAVDILEATARRFPNSIAVQRALAGGYLKAGRNEDSLAIFKAVPMQDANSGEFQGAIGAALAASDMAQAEAWLRVALERYPSDAGILSAAARFEQARGNQKRASDFLRASLAAMPAGSTASKADHLPLYSEAETGGRPAAQPDDLENLPDPGPQPGAARIVALPTYHSPVRNGNEVLPGSSASRSPVTPAPFAGTTAPDGAPVFIPRPAFPGTSSNQPTFIEQSATRPVVFRHASYNPQDAKNPPKYSGRVNLPPSEENVDSTDPDQNQPQAPSRTAKKRQAPPAAPPAPRLRITSEPMGDLAARTQALFAEQTDSQLTQGSAANLRAQGIVPAKPVTTPAAPASVPTRYAMAQYTPSAQEAATGAYSAPKKQSAQPQQPQLQPQVQPRVQPQQPCAQCVNPAPALKKAKKQVKPALSRAPAPTLATAPAAPLPQQPDVNELPGQAPATTGSGLTDQELQERNLPPLRGPWVRVQREQRAVNPRDEAEMQLRSIESGYSPWMGGTGTINYRSGDLGFDHLSALEAPFETSISMGYNARLTIVAKPVFLDSGQATGTSVIQVLEAASPGLPLTLTTIPQPIGSLTATDTNPPAQQNASGIGGEVQLAFPHLAIAGGYTPSGFLIATFTGRALWKPGNGPITFNFSRDSVKDTELSYGGLRDPLGNTLGNLGQIWGGVIANQGNVQFAHGDAQSGFYLAGGGQYITGYNIANNKRMEGSGGAYWRVKTVPEYGNLSIGANFFGMHYAKNQDAFTFGMGGYFSPQAYFLANAPITWNGHSGTTWHYNILGSFGVQAFQVDQTSLFPNNVITAYLPAKTSVGPNYDLRAQAAYQISPHWFAGGFLGANNSRNYSAATAGFYVRFLFRAQPSTATAPTGLFPTDGMRPFMVP
jgi:tetratricopeptide (TPR) repeat protein